ncbi:hypothetical protein C0995_014461 [Termitomyces sp. Mi166|nr:hypothetical protein C0995_014461 [Termitomyces sp. Mi166\
MAPKILLLHVTADSSLLEREHAAQEFIAAADAVFFKAQGLATLVPLHETVFGLLEGLLDNWRLLNLNSIKWPRKAEVHQACVNLWSLNKQVPWAAEFGKMVSTDAHEFSSLFCFSNFPYQYFLASFGVVALRAGGSSCRISIAEMALFILLIYLLSSSALSLTQEPPSQWSVPHNKGKGKANVTEDNEDKEEATQKFRKELEDFVVLTTFDDKLLASLLPPLLEYYKGDIGLLAIIALLTIWLITAGTQLANILAGTVIANPKAACGRA